MSGGGVTQAVGHGGPSVLIQALTIFNGIGASGQLGQIPLAPHIGIVLHQLGQIPVALQIHGTCLGEESGAGRGFRKIGLVGTPVLLLHVYVEFHRLDGTGVGISGLRAISGENMASSLIDKAPVAQLVVVIGHKAVFAGRVVNLPGGVRQILPGPVIGGVGDSCGVKHLLIVYQQTVVLVFRHAVEPPVAAAGIAAGNFGEVLFVIVWFDVIIKVCHVGQHAEVGVVQQLVGMHPEDVRHGVAFGGSFQLCPVFAPAGGLHLDHHIGMRGRRIR